MVTASSPRLRTSSRAGSALARRGAARAQRLTTTREVRRAIVSVAGLVGAPVRNQTGQSVGKLIDVVARMHAGDRYPPITGLLVRVGSRVSFLAVGAVAEIEHRAVTLRNSRLDLRDFQRRPGEVVLAKDVLDHQLVDVDGRQVIRAADLYLAAVGDDFRLVGLDVSLGTLIRRIGPRRLRGRPTPERVIDWDAVAPFGENLTHGPSTVQLSRSDDDLHRLQPGDLADLLEDLDRTERRALLDRLDRETAADALEEMAPTSWKRCCAKPTRPAPPSCSRRWNPMRPSTPCAICPSTNATPSWPTCPNPPGASCSGCWPTPNAAPAGS